MKTKVLQKSKKNLTGIGANISIMSFFLILGLAVGIFFAKNSDTSIINDFVGKDLVELVGNEGMEYSFLKTFFNLTKYTLILVFSAFCAIGVFLIPLVVFFKGFMISVSVSSLIAAFGRSGILCALSMFGIQTFVQIPVLLLVSAMSLEISKVSASVILPQKNKFTLKNAKIGEFLLFVGVCIVFLLLASILDFLITPKLVLIVSKTLFSQ